jgi:uncharacterized alkaline shock family protein YloU
MRGPLKGFDLERASRTGSNGAVEYHTAPTAPLIVARPPGGLRRVPSKPTHGRSLVTRQAVFDLIRTATLTSYGVTGFAASPLERLAGRLGVGQPGIGLRLDAGLEVDLDLTVAYGVPVAEVARQVDSAVRYTLRRGLQREVGRLTIHVDGLRVAPGSPPTIVPADPSAIRPRDLADSGSDVA